MIHGNRLAITLCWPVLGCLWIPLLCATTQTAELPANPSGNIAEDKADYIEAPGGAWRLAAGDVNGDGKPEIAYTGIEWALRCLDPDTGRILWKYPLDGFGYQVRAADLDGDGRSEFVVPCASGTLHVVSPNGQPRWTYRSPLQILDAAIVELTSGDKLVACGGYDETLSILNSDGELCAEQEIAHSVSTKGRQQRYIHRMVAADLDGDGDDELAVVVGRTNLQIFDFANGRPELIRETSLRADNPNWENASGVFNALSIRADDLKGDGTDEMVLGEAFWSGHQLQVLDGKGQRRWLTPTLKSRGYAYGDGVYEFYSFAMAETADLDPKTRDKEIIVVTGNNFRIYSSAGQQLKMFDAEIGFTDVLRVGNVLYLGSSPNGDETLYRVSLDGDWSETVRALKWRGKIVEISQNIASLREQIQSRHGRADPGDDLYWFPLLSGRQFYSDPAGIKARTAPLWDQLASHANLVATTQVEYLEDRPVLGTDGRPFRAHHAQVKAARTRDEILRREQEFEQAGVPHHIAVAHSTRAQITLETIKAIIDEAPETLDGFVCAELMQREFLPHFFEHYFGPIQDMCLTRGHAKCYTRNKNSWWAAVPSQKNLFDAFIAGPRGRTLVAGVEPSNSRSYRVDLCAKMGLRQAGLIDHIQTTVIDDWFHASNDYFWLYPKHGHPYLRGLVVGVLMGADHLKFRIPHFRDGEFTEMGLESTEVVLDMLGMGLLKRPRPEDMIGISKVGIAVHPMSATWIDEAFNNHKPGLWKQTCNTPEMHDAVMPKNGVTWAYAPTPEHALERVLFHKKWQLGYIPATPYGPVAIVPIHADLTKVKCVERWLHTDGLYLWKDGGEKLNGKAAANLLRETYRKAAAELPIRPRGDDVFFLTVRDGDEGLLVYAVDPGCFDPADRQVEATIQLPGQWVVEDRLSGVSIPVVDRKFHFTVPAGCFRMLSATQQRHDRSSHLE